MSAASAPAAHGGFRDQIANSHEVLPDAAPDQAHAAMRQASAAWASAYDETADTLDRFLNYDPRRANNLVGASITLGLSVIMIILMAIVAGYFVAEAPSNGSFTDAINQVEDVGGTAFILLAVALLAVPVVAIVGYFVNSGLGGFISGGTMRR
jgi:CHASE3 domain sensor protein